MCCVESSPAMVLAVYIYYFYLLTFCYVLIKRCELNINLNGALNKTIGLHQ